MPSLCAHLKARDHGGGGFTPRRPACTPAAPSNAIPRPHQDDPCLRSPPPDSPQRMGSGPGLASPGRTGSDMTAPALFTPWGADVIDWVAGIEKHMSSPSRLGLPRRFVCLSPIIPTLRTIAGGCPQGAGGTRAPCRSAPSR